ncbi:MAG: tripartite tricarboxylate transporter substrate-binding protein [Betaproteobacteria bacterium]|nr:tripartite tricarboxylate transporter substrate-binding protein [Betaproteobacteria bacterium]MDH5220225.1 tripartite tricarboxylate transporter substrate-binding protein [Betaproteobacteria bacterium]MDH5349890.1 tripartite tricarboxylate transporter substrate-binding protein [Betaproteobacteria bacterium]
MRTIMHTSRRRLIKAAVAGALAASLPLAAHAADFRGKTIDFVIPFPVAGGSDVWARFYAPFMTKYLPGNPTVVVKNVPGGGSTRGANEFAERAKPDGLTILGTSGSTQFPYLLGDTRVRYEYKDWTPVLASPTGGVVFVNANLGVKSAADIAALRKAKLIYGSEGATSLSLVPMLAFRQLDLPVQYVFGMKARGGARLAFERGESNIDYQTSSAYLASVVPLVKAGKAVPLFSWGVLDASGKLARDPTFPDLPHVGEVIGAAGGKQSGLEWDTLMAFITAGFGAQKIVVLPKGTPKDIVAAYSQAFGKMQSDPQFAATKEKILGEYPQATGKDAETLYRVATQVSPASRYWVREHLVQNYGVKFE